MFQNALFKAILASLVLLSIGLTWSCSSGLPADQSMDRLEQALGRLESAVNSAQSRVGIGLSDELTKNLNAAGHEVQVAYAEVQATDPSELSNEQGTRRSTLGERSVAAIADFLNIMLSDKK